MHLKTLREIGSYWSNSFTEIVRTPTNDALWNLWLWTHFIEVSLK
ncbi:hypothetical protein LEP1GSC168_2000 [Leptospira santarosai str. HAI134]|nr:hypothetical protein LEP1GSC163_4053 [Leptospira santarosai str. CBC379]EMO22886.1 hypothetical protein LEP1GSC168_2000 [Leptospira santarosai str. HAI134]